MRSPVSSLLLASALVCALAAPAAADGIYLTESFGGADVKDQLGERVTSVGRLRLSVGYRRGRWAAELWGGVYLGMSERSTWDAGAAETGTAEAALTCNDCPSHPEDHASSSTWFGGYGLDLKYLQPLSRHVELYLRGGASRLRGSVQGDPYGGRGLGLGAGAQLKGKVSALGFLFWPLFFSGIGPKVTGALWVDAGHDFHRLHRGSRMDGGSTGPTIDAQMSMLSFGVAFGTDF